MGKDLQGNPSLLKSNWYSEKNSEHFPNKVFVNKNVSCSEYSYMYIIFSCLRIRISKWSEMYRWFFWIPSDFSYHLFLSGMSNVITCRCRTLYKKCFIFLEITLIEIIEKSSTTLFKKLLRKEEICFFSENTSCSRKLRFKSCPIFFFSFIIFYAFLLRFDGMERWGPCVNLTWKTQFLILIESKKCCSKTSLKKI